MQKLTSIINTKLHKPPITSEHVLRARLIKIIESNIYKPLTLICAPAGYGKSMLMSSTLDKIGKPFAWYSLDKDDNNIRLFLKYFTAAIQKKFPDKLTELVDLINGSELPPLDILSKTLINNLDEIEEEFLVVLDDYHLISDENVHSIISLIIKYPPQNMHLALLSRRDPPLNLISLKSHSRINEIRMSELSFSSSEIKKLYKNLLNVELDKITIKNLLDKTEGWIAGLRLATLTINNPNNFSQIFNNFKGDVNLISEYFISELLSNQSTEMRSYLIRSSILERFCPELIDALNEDVTTKDEKLNGKKFIESLIKSNLFLISLDDEKEWYRYHHLFRELLQNQFIKNYNKDEEQRFHKLASNWFESNELIEVALKHCLNAGDISNCEKLLANYRYDLINKEDWYTLDYLLNMLPDKSIDKNPALLLAKAFLYDYRGQIVEMFSYRDKAESMLSTIPDESIDKRALQGEIAVLNGEQQILFGNAKLGIENARKALELLPPQALHIWSYAIGEKVLAYQMLGDIEQGLHIVKETLNKHDILPGISEARMMLWYCMAFWMEGDMISIEQPAQRCLELGEQHNLPDSIGFGKYFLGAMHFVRGEFSKAELILKSVVDEPFKNRPNYFIQSVFLISLIYNSEGRYHEVSKVIEFAINHTNATNELFTMAIIEAFRVELALKQGNLQKAQSLNKNIEYESLPPIWFFYIPQLTPIKILLAENTSTSLKKALIQLEIFDEAMKKINRKTIRIDVLALKALVLDAQGKESAAFEKLNESIELAQHGELISNFVDFGEPMHSLLKRFKTDVVKTDYITRLLNAFANKKSIASVSDAEVVALDGEMPKNKILLSTRENEILILVAEGLRNKEIAETLFLSPLTIKKHIYNIFQKLNVKSRIYAVEKAKELKILSLN